MREIGLIWRVLNVASVLDWLRLGVGALLGGGSGTAVVAVVFDTIPPYSLIAVGIGFALLGFIVAAELLQRRTPLLETLPGIASQSYWRNLVNERGEIEEQRDVHDVVYVDVRNARETGGERVIARGVHPEVEITDTNGTQQFNHAGWDFSGQRDFAPIGERHRFYVAEKWRSDPIMFGVRGDPRVLETGPDAIVGAAPFRAEVTLRGMNLRKPFRERFFLRISGDNRLYFVSIAPYEAAIKSTTGIKGPAQEVP